MTSTAKLPGSEDLREIERLNWTLTAISKVNSVLVRATTELELYKAICEAVTFQDIFVLAWIGIPRDDEKKSVHIIESAGKSSPFLDNLEVSWEDAPSGPGPIGGAIRSGQAQFDNHMLANPHLTPWRERTSQWHLESSFCLPIKLGNGQVVAVLMVHSKIPYAFGESELEILSQLGEDIGYGVDALRTRAAYLDEMRRRERAEEELARVGRIAVVQSVTTSLAHELNQPLAAILGNAEVAQLFLAKENLQNNSVTEILGDIHQSAHRASEIIRNLRILMEKRDIAMTTATINPLVQQAVDLMRWNNARRESIRIELQLADALPPVNVNAIQIQQVLINLIGNARDAIQLEGVTDGLITIKAQQNDPRWLNVSVTDNGPGIPADRINQIFDPLFTTKDGGIGMGLWIAGMIVEQHGGKLEASNTAAGGARFSFSLPVSMQP